MITSFTPAANVLIITGTQPVTWNSGTTRMKHGGRSSGDGGVRSRSMAPRQANPKSACTMARWVDTAPLGRPVVPDV